MSLFLSELFLLLVLLLFPHILLEPAIDHFCVAPSFPAAWRRKRPVDNVGLLLLVLGLFLTVHLLDLTHLSLLVEVLIGNDLRLGLDLLHGFHQSALLARLGLLYLLTWAGVVLFNLFFL
jgi:hypothetical protein